MSTKRPSIAAAFLVAVVQSLSASSTASAFLPLQLEVRVPFEPTAFPSGGHNHLTYELYLTNFSTSPVHLHRIEVWSDTTGEPRPIATFEAKQLDALLRHTGARQAPDAATHRQLAAGASAVVFLSLTLDTGTPVPSSLRHRIVAGDNSSTTGPAISTRHTQLRVLGPPVKGANWLASAGPSNDSYHRRGIVVFSGRPAIDRRYAIDWMQIKDGAAFSGDKLDNRAYHAYGEAVLAVADGTVVIARDGIAENTPAHEGFRPAVPLSLETVAGNAITLDLGGGQFAHYMHLQTGSLRIKPGDRVRRGQLLARIGSSGDSREPHLHFEVTNSRELLAGEGVPYLIDRYRAKLADGTWQLRTRELPLKDMSIEFGP